MNTQKKKHANIQNQINNVSNSRNPRMEFITNFSRIPSFQMSKRMCYPGLNMCPNPKLHKLRHKKFFKRCSWKKHTADTTSSTKAKTFHPFSERNWASTAALPGPSGAGGGRRGCAGGCLGLASALGGGRVLEAVTKQAIVDLPS